MKSTLTDVHFRNTERLMHPQYVYEELTFHVLNDIFIKVCRQCLHGGNQCAHGIFLVNYSDS